jgi:hypothetical protein
MVKNDFEFRRTQEALKEQDAHIPDLKHAPRTVKDYITTAGLYGITSSCLMSSSWVIAKIGDHVLAGIYYLGCITLRNVITYKSFRKIWQSGFMPFKEALGNWFRFFKFSN